MGGIMRKLAFVLFLSAAGCHPHVDVSGVAPASILAPTDKTLWLVTDSVRVGTILRTDPALWKQRGRAYFVKYSDFLVGRIPTDAPRSGMSESIQLNNSLDIGATIPFLKKTAPSVAASIDRSRSVDFKTDNTTIDQYTSLLQVQLALQTADNDKNRGREGNELLGVLNSAGKLAAEDAAKSHYWMVTKVYRAGTVTWKTDAGNTASISASCPGTDTNCTLAKASVGATAGNNSTGKDAIVFVQVKPVLYNMQRGTLYLADPDPNGQSPAPKVVAAS